MFHFKLSEFLVHGDECYDIRTIHNADKVINNIMQLNCLLEWLRNFVGAPIYINSGYRTPIHNAIVGGVTNSQHLDGSAVDITCKDFDLNKKLAEGIEYLQTSDYVKDKSFGQAIFYTDLTHKLINFVHLSLPNNKHKNQIMWK